MQGYSKEVAKEGIVTTCFDTSASLPSSVPEGALEPNIKACVSMPFALNAPAYETTIVHIMNSIHDS